MQKSHARAGECERPSSRQRIVTAARMLFGSRGFHSTSMADLAAEADVSVGQIYRYFPGKDEIIVAIVEEDVHEREAAMEEIFTGIERKTLSALDGIKAFVKLAVESDKAGLQSEMLAESYRNPRVAERIREFSARCRAGVAQLEARLEPLGDPDEREARIDLMMACSIGFVHHALSGSTLDTESLCARTARLLMRTLSTPAD